MNRTPRSPAGRASLSTAGLAPRSAAGLSPRGTTGAAPHSPAGLAPRWLRRVALALAALVGVGSAAALLLVATALCVLRASPGDWAVRVGAGRLGVDLGVPALVRVATHPLGVRALAGRRFSTGHGVVRVEALAGAGRRDGEAALRLVCAPCTVAAASLASLPIRVARVEATVVRVSADELRGTLVLDAVPLRWHARLTARGADLELDAVDVPVADVVALFGPAVPEAAQARIAGRAGVALRLALPSGRHTLLPRLDGLAVSGLGAEALVGATPAPSCARAPRRAAANAAAPYGVWLPRAVLAAEDQRFFEHPGWDLTEMAAAWRRDDGPHRGASTITQQLAKLLYTGDEHTVARKVRELLHGADLESALGKARLLELYLGVAPWGDGQCGGEAAALHYFGRPAASLTAAEATWLASLLRHPDAELERWARGDETAARRLAAIADGLRPPAPTTRAQQARLHEAIERFVPPPGALAMRRPGEPPASRLAAAR